VRHTPPPQTGGYPRNVERKFSALAHGQCWLKYLDSNVEIALNKVHPSDAVGGKDQCLWLIYPSGNVGRLLSKDGSRVESAEFGKTQHQPDTSVDARVFYVSLIGAEAVARAFMEEI
jgi:hypothetical protein